VIFRHVKHQHQHAIKETTVAMANFFVGLSSTPSKHTIVFSSSTSAVCSQE